VEAPRAASYSFPSSFEPHDYHPGRLSLESRIDRGTGEALADLGHCIAWWPDWTWLAGAVCTIIADRESGVLKGGADPRRPSYALWTFMPRFSRHTRPAFSSTERCLEIAGCDIMPANRSAISPAVMSLFDR
jgi:hypothetical protein